jgi:CHASE2 domain-containing sensor protein
VKAILQSTKFRAPALGAVLAIAAGLGSFSASELQINASYDHLFRFSARRITNQVALILMDNDAYSKLGQTRGQAWSRQRHAELLNKLADDRCPLVVFDVFFRPDAPQEGDAALAAAIRRHGHVVLMAKVTNPRHPGERAAQVELPDPRFLDVATNWGVTKLTANVGGTVRHHWRWPLPESFPSLPETAARLAGAPLPESPAVRWLRYYGRDGQWEIYSYHLALAKPSAHFQNKLVFIGNKPATPAPGDELEDEFRTPYTRWTDEGAGGVEILATTTLNLVNGDWLRRPAWWLETVVFVLAGALLGGGLCRLHPLVSGATALAAAVGVTLAAATLSHFTNYWFPWLVVVGGQAPVALAWALAVNRRELAASWRMLTAQGPTGTVVVAPPEAPVAPAVAASGALPIPDPGPDFELVLPEFGSGGFGRVWLVRTQAREWRALKAVYKANFTTDSIVYDTERRGVERYKPFSYGHAGLLRVEFLSAHRPEGYFYYVMQLADPVDADWEINGERYKPLDLVNFCEQRPNHRLPVAEAAQIISSLADALQYLHDQKLVHRDIKPSNIVFVTPPHAEGQTKPSTQPKLADVGCVGEARLPKDVTTWIGTEYYMPSRPEPPGTVQADVYALGKVLFVISTGCHPQEFPIPPETLVEQTGEPTFMRLNPIILKACEPDSGKRYASAAELAADLRKLMKEIGVTHRTPG